MDVVSTCPLRVGSIVWQPRPSAWTLTVICKATFVLAPGESRLADVQEEPIPHDRHLGGDAAKSLFAASDLVPHKPRAEVLLVGSAFAPQRRPARAVATRLNVGDIDKRVEVWCDRVFWQDGRLLEGQPFVQMPLIYERAAGGPATGNPVGMRFDAPPDAYGSVPIPNLQPAGLAVPRRGDTFAPIAYGPISPTWPGRTDTFNSAPLDQQLTTIRPDERIVLEGLHPEYPLLETRLPGLRPRAHVMAGSSIQEEIELVADTLWIDTDRGLATVVWRGRFALSHAREEGRIAVSMAAAGSAIAPARHAAEDPTLLGDLGGADSGTAQLPRSEIATILGSIRSLDAQALPFKAAPSAWAGFQNRPAASPQVALPEDSGTVFGALSPAREALPFAAPIAPLNLEPEPEPEQIGPLARVNTVAPEADVAPAEAAPSHDLPASEPTSLIDEYPLERCAAITASIARRRAEKAQILEDNRLDAAKWAAIEQHWSDAVAAETGRGRTALLDAFDTAYVARLEEERGKVLVEEYARLQVAAERGNVAEVLRELTLPRGAMIRIERVWLKKTANDDGLGKSVRDAVTAAREA